MDFEYSDKVKELQARLTAFTPRGRCPVDKVVLADSGGLDTSVAIPWLHEHYGLEVIAVTADVGNERDFTTIREKALRTGASTAS